MLDTPASLPAPTLPRPASGPPAEDPLWKAVQGLERSFLSEMLKSAGLGTPRSGFGGGIGEDQFASFLRDAQAEAMVEAGGIGLAEQLFRALREAEE